MACQMFSSASRLVMAAFVAVLFSVCATVTVAQTFSTLVTFDGLSGANPVYGSLVQGTDGNFYGTTGSGGAHSLGTVFKVTSGGTLTTLYNFCAEPSCPDGSSPYAGLVQATDGNFYGTTLGGGANGKGTVFKITSKGVLTTLHSFAGTDGSEPIARLVQATGTTVNLYGTAFSGGANGNGGTVFKITSAGTFTTLYSFCARANCADGEGPTALVQATDGNFYGTTYSGGADAGGTAFKITLTGTLTTLYNFCSVSNCTDGYYPSAGLVQATDGNFYGTTTYGGTDLSNGNGGTVFKVTSGGTLTTLYNFCSVSNCVDGDELIAGLIQASDGNFYGTTASGGSSTLCTFGCGTIFEITSGGTLTTLHSFDNTDGFQPYSGLLQATSGSFYGTPIAGGTGNNGTIFSLATGPVPFVEARSTSGKVGAKVILLGTNLMGAASVTFSGTEATFTVVSDSEIKTTVPNDATTGMVKVITPSGTFMSNVPFRVQP